MVARTWAATEGWQGAAAPCALALQLPPDEI